MLDVVENLDMIIRTCSVLKEIYENLWKLGKCRVSCGHVVMWSCGHVLIPRVSALFLLLAGVCLGRAQVYGQVQETVDNAILTAKVSIPGVTSDGHRISGTNVALSCESKAQNNGASVSDPVVQVRLKQAVLTIGGEFVYSDVFTVAFNEPEPVSEASSLAAPVPQVQEPVLYPDVRDPRDVIFASTKFEHQAEVEVSLTLTYTLKRSSGATAEHELDAAVITPQAYNKLLLWRTYCNENGYPLLPQYEDWIDEALAELILWYELANYEVEFVLPDLTGWPIPVNKDDILAGMNDVTSVAGLSHGNAQGVTDSAGIGSQSNIAWSEIESALGDRYTPPALTPQVSHLFFFSCGTIPGQLNSHFWLTRVPRAASGNIVNAANLGFDRPYKFCAEERVFIETLFDHLHLGFTMQQALEVANAESPLPARTTVPTSTPEYALGVLLGDADFATFGRVYLPPSVRAAQDGLPYANWWWALPHTP